MMRILIVTLFVSIHALTSSRPYVPQTSFNPKVPNDFNRLKKVMLDWYCTPIHLSTIPCRLRTSAKTLKSATEDAIYMELEQKADMDKSILQSAYKIVYRDFCSPDRNGKPMYDQICTNSIMKLKWGQPSG